MARLAPLIALLALGCGWGLHLVLAKLVGAETMEDTLGFLVLYMFGASVILGGLMLAFSRPFRPRWRHLPFFTISATFGYVGPVIIELTVAPRIDAALFALIAGLAPVMTVAIAVAIRHRPLTAKIALATTCGTLAAIVLFAPEASIPSGEARLWAAAGLLLPLTYATDNVYVAIAWPEDLDAWQVAGAEAALSVGLALCLLLITGSSPGALVEKAGQVGWPLLGMVLLSGVTVALYFHLVHRHGAIFISFAGFLALGAGVAYGVAFFGETMTSWLWLAAALTLGALWLSRPEPEPASD